MESLFSQLGIDPVFLGPTFLAILGYFGFIVRDIPTRIWDYVKQRKSVSIQMISSNWGTYHKGIEFMIQKFPELTKHIQYEGIEVNLADGVYTYPCGFLTYAVISKGKLSNVTNDIQYEVAVTIIGLHREKLFNEYSEYHRSIYTRNDDCIGVLYCSSNGRIYSNDKVMKRSFDSIFIPKKIKQNIIDHLNRFNESNEMYKRMGITKKLGILLTGAPGTGKTSVAKAIASYLKYDIFMCSSDDYMNYLGDKNRVFVFEDIDLLLGEKRDLKVNKSDKIPTFQEVEQRQFAQPSNKLSLELPKIDTHKLMQVLDGMISHDNTVFIATTNVVENLDPALIRPGRFDLRFEIPPMDKECAKEMCDYYGVSYDLMKGLDFNSPEVGAVLQNRIIKYTISSDSQVNDK